MYMPYIVGSQPLVLYSCVCRHFDLNNLWTKQKEFAAGVFKTVIQTMQVRLLVSLLLLTPAHPFPLLLPSPPPPPSPQQQDRYKGIQALVDHLDAKSQESCDLKQGILDTLSQCVAVAAGGSIGRRSQPVLLITNNIAIYGPSLYTSYNLVFAYLSPHTHTHTHTHTHKHTHMHIHALTLKHTHSHTLGPSVLDVFRTLVKHLRISVESSMEVRHKSDRPA